MEAMSKEKTNQEVRQHHMTDKGFKELVAQALQGNDKSLAATIVSC